jgi:hypothetical protein
LLFLAVSGCFRGALTCNPARAGGLAPVVCSQTSMPITRLPNRCFVAMFLTRGVVRLCVGGGTCRRLRAIVAIGAVSHEGHAALKEHAGVLTPLLAARATFIGARPAEDRPAYKEEEGFSKSLAVLLEAAVGSASARAIASANVADGGAGGAPPAAARAKPAQLALPLAPSAGGEVAAGTWHPSTSTHSTTRPQEDFEAGDASSLHFYSVAEPRFRLCQLGRLIPNASSGVKVET